MQLLSLFYHLSKGILNPKLMKIENLFLIMAAGIFVLANAAQSQALTIDFRDNAWEASEGFQDFTLGDVTLRAHPAQATLWHDSIDGIGIIFDYENDEIEEDEILEVSFASLIQLDSIGIADFFYECRWGGCYSETGYYSLDGTTWNLFTAPNPSNSNGEMSIAVGQVVSSVWFMAPGNIGTQDHEFALQNLVVTQLVPEPGTLILLASGIVLIVPWLRRRKHQIPH